MAMADETNSVSPCSKQDCTDWTEEHLAKNGKPIEVENLAKAFAAADKLPEKKKRILAVCQRGSLHQPINQIQSNSLPKTAHQRPQRQK